MKAKYGKHIASVVHLAAYYSFAEEESPKYEDITVKGSKIFLELLKDFEVEQFIFSSTMLVHKPSWTYPESIVAAEKILKSQPEDIHLVNLRTAGVYMDRDFQLHRHFVFKSPRPRRSLPKGKFRKHFGNYDKLARWSPFEMRQNSSKIIHLS